MFPKLTEPLPGSHRSDDSPPRSIPPGTPLHTEMTIWSLWLIVNGAGQECKKKNSSGCWWIQRNYLPEVMSVVLNINNLNKQEREREGGETEWNGCNKCEGGQIMRRLRARPDLPVCRSIPGDTDTGRRHDHTWLRCNIHISHGSRSRMSQQDRD